MPRSRQQVKLAHVVLEGKSKAMPKTVAREIVDQMHGRKMSSLPRKVKTNKPSKSR